MLDTKKVSSLSCARQVVETVPMIMRLIRSALRSTDPSLSMPQVRVLAFLSHSPGASVSDVGQALDVTIATASALVDRLVRKQLVQREGDPQERRRVILTLTKEGKELLEDSRASAQATVAQLLLSESPEKLAKISEGLALLAKAAQTSESERATARQTF